MSLKLCTFAVLTLSRASFFGAPVGKAESLSKIESWEKSLVSMETMVWFIVFRFFTRNHHSKIKNIVPLNKSEKSYFFSKLMKN